jgi:hypothetical protein
MCEARRPGGDHDSKKESFKMLAEGGEGKLAL